VWESVQLWREKFCDRRNSNKCDSETQGQKGNKVQYLSNKHIIQNKKKEGESGSPALLQGKNAVCRVRRHQDPFVE
jgi:hypothetical protein